MPYHFYDCYTPDEVKARYRKLSKTLHPDSGGTDEQFTELQRQYDSTIDRVRNLPKLPPLFHVTGDYEYKGAKVVYFQRDCHWYKFHKDGGADIHIDQYHTYLIKQRDKAIAA